MSLVESKVHARTVLLTISTDGGTTYLPAACLTENSLETTRAALDANTECGNAMEPGDIIKQTVSIAGETVNSVGTAVKASVSQLYGYMTAGTILMFKYGHATPVTGDPVYAFSGVVSKMNIVDKDGELETFTATIEITNPPATLTIT
jgi:hypothetical protein